MTLALFSFIGWITIIILFIIPRKLGIIESLILYMCMAIIVINLFTITDLNLKLVQHSNKANMFISLLVQRTIIIPVVLLIYSNLVAHSKSYFLKLMLTIFSVLILYLVELMTVYLGVKSYSGWNNYLNLISLTGLALLSALITWLLERQEGKFIV